jgi:electron transfer flavoprotein beta subunit
MNIVVPVKFVPDLVEELVIDESGLTLDASWVRLVLNELDEHAIEQAILLKEAGGGQVTIIALDVEGADDVLYTAAAKGADRLIKLTGSRIGEVGNYALGRILANAVKALRPELILCGVQAHNDLDGSVGPQLAEQLGMPYVGYVAGVAAGGDRVTVRKEYPGGLLGEMVVSLPAVLGIQAAEKPPRYVPISRIRQAMRTTTIEDQSAAEPESPNGLTVSRMAKPEVGERAQMIEGDVDQIAARLTEIFKQLGAI